MRVVVWMLLSSLVAGVAAQAVPAARSLDDLRRAFAERRDRLRAQSELSREQEADVARREVAELSSFVEHEAAGDDRWHGRLWLAELNFSLRDRDAAVAAVRGIDLDAAPGLLLLRAAEMAARLGQKVLRDTMVDRAVTQDASLEDRLEMAVVLMTLLREVPRGERIFTEALAAAGNDEQRAMVRWRQCEAIREREDLPENSYYDALEKLAKDLPATYYGSVARDRGTASQFKIGAPAIPFAATATDGARVELAKLRGKAVILAFWSPRERDGKNLADALLALQKQHGDDLAVVGVGLDTDAAAFTAAARALGATFPQICDGRGWQAELALRYHVETVPTLIAVDRGGAIAGLNLHVETRSAREDLDAALRLALQRGQ